MQFDYSLRSMLPFARAAIRTTSNFEIRQFADLLFGELEKAQVPGVVRKQSGPTKFDFNELNCSHQLRTNFSERDHSSAFFRQLKITCGHARSCVEYLRGHTSI
jgi:hypothetical protein